MLHLTLLIAIRKILTSRTNSHHFLLIKPPSTTIATLRQLIYSGRGLPQIISNLPFEQPRHWFAMCSGWPHSLQWLHLFIPKATHAWHADFLQLLLFPCCLDCIDWTCSVRVFTDLKFYHFVYTGGNFLSYPNLSLWGVCRIGPLQNWPWISLAFLVLQQQSYELPISIHYQECL